MAEICPLGSWDELEKELFTPEEIAESELRVAMIGEMIKAKQDRGMSEEQLEELSGVRQPIIARMEKGSTSPQLDTVLKVLARRMIPWTSYPFSSSSSVRCQRCTCPMVGLCRNICAITANYCIIAMTACYCIIAIA